MTRGDDPVALPKSQKTRALLAYLAVTARAHARERLCSMFWDATDDTRGALRWSLSKLRALDDPERPRVRADRSEVAFIPNGAYVDVLEVREAEAAGLSTLSSERLSELAAAFRGGFLDGIELPDFHEFQAWRVAERAQLRGLQLKLLSELVERTAQDPERALDPARERVRIAPEDEGYRARLIGLLASAGRREEAAEHYALGRRQLDKIGVGHDELRRTFQQVSAQPGGDAAQSRDLARQQVRFCSASDGVRIAYATLGRGPTLVKTANWLSHLEHDWRSPLWRHLARELSRDFTLLRYDQRGSGLSDWEVADLSLGAFVSDLESVVEAAAEERFALLGISQGCRIAIAYAVEHPERVSRLVLYGGAARGWKRRDESVRKVRGSLLDLIEHGWGQDNPAFRQVFTTLFMPEASQEQSAWFNELQRVSSSPRNAARITAANAEFDVSELLGKVSAPTLVLHAVDDAVTPFEEGRRMAAAIPGARFVGLQSHNHLLLDDEPAFARFLSELRAFLQQP